MELSDVKKFIDMFGRFDTDQWRQRHNKHWGQLRGQRPRARRERRTEYRGLGLGEVQGRRSLSPTWGFAAPGMNFNMQICAF